VESSCEFGIEPSGSMKSGKLSSGLTTGGLSSSAELRPRADKAVSSVYAVCVIWRR
jgi:hypothetical protein